MEEYKENQRRLREELNEILARNQGVMDSIREKDPAGNWSFEDLGVEGEFDDVLDSLGDRSRKELLEVWKALQRIDNGTYGTCSDCGRKISAERLEALPATELCVECAAKLEAR